MSYDFYMAAPLGRDGAMVAIGRYDLNYTYNVSAMFRQALGGDGVNDLHGVIGADALPRLRTAARHMQDNRPLYEAMNPENGWGNYAGALRVLHTLAEWCEEMPGAYVQVG